MTCSLTTWAPWTSIFRITSLPATSASRTWSRGEPYQLPWTSFASRKPRSARIREELVAGHEVVVDAVDLAVPRRARRAASRRSGGRRRGRVSASRRRSASMIVSLPDAGRPRDDDQHRPGRAVDDVSSGRPGSVRDVRHRSSRPRHPAVVRRRRRSRPVAVARAARRGPAPARRGAAPRPGSAMPLDRRRQLEPPGVEEQALERRRPARTSRAPPRRPRPVDRVARDRMADRLEMDPDLVRPAGHEVQLEQRPARRTARGPGSRSWTPGRRGRRAIRVRCFGSRPIGASIRPTAAATSPSDEREVRLLDPARLELGHQRVLRGVGPGDHQQAARVAVEAVDDARPLDAGDPAERPAPPRASSALTSVSPRGPATDGRRGRPACRRSAGRRPRRRRERDLRRRREVERLRLRDDEAERASRADRRLFALSAHARRPSGCRPRSASGRGSATGR